MNAFPLLETLRRGAPAPPRLVGAGRLGEWSRHARTLRRVLFDPAIPRIDGSAVCRWYYEDSDKEFWNLLEDFPNLTPPPGADACWIEYPFPERISSDVFGALDVRSILPPQVRAGRTGVLVLSPPLERTEASGVPPGTDRIVCAELFIDYGIAGKPAEGPHGTWFAPLAKGRLNSRPAIRSFLDGPEDERNLHEAAGWIFPALAALCVLNGAPPRGAEHLQVELTAPRGGETTT